MIRLPNRILTYLSMACGAVFAAYVVFMVAAVCFASVEMGLSREARVKESAVVALETEYYAAIARLTASEPEAAGYVTPNRVEYVTADGAPALSRVSR